MRNIFQIPFSLETIQEHPNKKFSLYICDDGFTTRNKFIITPRKGIFSFGIYIYIYISGDSSLFLLLVPPTPPPSVNFNSQPVVRGPKVSHHSCYCVILHCIAQIDKRTLHGVFFCKQSRYYIICSLVNTVDKIIFFFLSKV